MPTTLDAERLRHEWNEIRGDVRERWGQLSDDDLIIHGGNVEQFVNRLSKVTGASVEEVEDFLNDLLHGSSQPAAAARYAAQAKEWMGMHADQAARQVRQAPGISVATAVGLGLLAGVTVGLLIRRR